ncbi:pectin/pectin esterase [Haloferula helveola]|uniref:Pectinesterase n=1 Tax=Haloferula helveola TaxID=490095 RepID=A0ABN6H697_9BACT|nr:pectin/pectin esterase [Haloferula helveola]
MVCRFACSLALAICAVDASDTWTVSADGLGDFKTLQAAIDKVPEGKSTAIRIRLMPGLYVERVMIPRSKGPIHLFGDDAETTVITFNNSAETLDDRGRKIGTSRSASVFIESDGFRARNVTFENSHGRGSQALAVNVSGDRAAFDGCRFVGYQDTLLLNRGRQYFENCLITGDVDFIFGEATAFFENCTIHCRGSGYITAASTQEKDEYGFVFRRCRITADEGDWQFFLGRPWRPHGAVMWLDCEMSDRVRPEGWDNWRNPENEKTARYVEWRTRGTDTGQRVKWAGTLTDREARSVTPYRVLRKWDAPHTLEPARVAALRDDLRPAWESYISESARRMEADRAALAAELKREGRKIPLLPPDGPDFKLRSRADAKWFAGDEARRLAEAAISFQTPAGGWSKHVRLDQGPRKPGMHWTAQGGESGWHYVGTIDNRSTTEQLKLLRGVAEHLPAAKESFLKGIDYLLVAQFPNGGWPQVYPLEGGYHDHVTFNDNAMLHVLELFRDLLADPPEFIEPKRLAAVRSAFEKGIECVLDAQVRTDGERTVWCAQHDPLTLEPVEARLMEPASLSGGESAALVAFLMGLENPSPEVRQAVEAALDWFESHELETTDNDRRWARFYDPVTGQPIFPGADGIIYGSFDEMAKHHPVGYDYFSGKPADLLKRRGKWSR